MPSQPVLHLPARLCRIDHFLGAGPNEALLDAVEALEEERYEVTSVHKDDGSRVDRSVRSSLTAVVDTEALRARVLEVAHGVSRLLDIAGPFTQIECSLQVYRDGDFFKAHRDDGSGDYARRAMTFVYYAHREPASFTGGALRLFDRAMNLTSGDDLASVHYRDVTPANDTVVFFAPQTLHEVLPVRATADTAMRNAVNGWLLRAAPALQESTT
jgi:SM-20-related protein